MLTTSEISKLLMQAILLFVAQKWLVLSLPACMVILYVVQKVYLRTSRQLRFLDLESHAAVFSSFLESVSISLGPSWNVYILTYLGRRPRNNSHIRLAPTDRRRQYFTSRELTKARVPTLMSAEVAQYRS